MSNSSSGAGDFLIVAIGASAGGLEACRTLVRALPADTGMALILVQHLDPTHESMMVELLADHTLMTVRQATDGLLLERDHLYIIPPATYLSVAEGALHLSEPLAPHGARMPFDFLLHSLAQAYAERAVCVILSGTGSDGSLGLKSVKERGGFVIAQDPGEAGYDGMPRSAIGTGAVDVVLPAAQIPGALVEHKERMARAGSPQPLPRQNGAGDRLPEIVELLRTKTAHDFRLYKPGTLQRRIERRMAMAAIEPDGADRYVEMLSKDARELDLLATDLLINVTSFFRDPKVFDYLAEKIVPGLVGDHPSDQSLRIWVAGCSTGEETYSLAMLFREAIAAANREIRLQVFASDVDPDAVESAREGLYPETIEAEVSPSRLARFFSKGDHGYRVSPDLRSAVVFTVQDVLADPPFSRIDLVSCRNLLIYLSPAAQTKIISLFHFALRPGGILLLGGSETAGDADGRFEMISKPEQVYRHIGRSRPGEIYSLMSAAGSERPPARLERAPAAPRQAALAELCERMVIEAYAPAAVLINRKLECLYSSGSADRYLRVASGYPTHDLIAMAPQGVRHKLRSAIQRALDKKARIVVPGGTISAKDGTLSFNIDVRPVLAEGEELLLVCFVDVPKRARRRGGPITPAGAARIAELEQELEATRTELQYAIHSLEIAGEEQKAINEEALSVNEEYQSTNEELLTSKEELQSLNEELTALNSQLQETLERQRTTSNDLQNVLYSTDVATLFLDANLKIRFFTPATRSLFSVIPGDVGRPLADLNSLAMDGALTTDARAVLQSGEPIEREIEAQDGLWFVRRILPYRAHDDGVEGVVITFTDITDRKLTARALEAAKQRAELANVAKSRFLAVASHDLRQPLQSLVLLQGLIAKVVQGERGQTLVARLEQTLGAMSGMLNTLLDINQIEAGVVRAEMMDFPINEMLERLAGEFAYHAQAQKLDLRVVPCGLSIHSDPRLLEQMVRNLISNALKYTRRGKVLLGCRRREGMVCIEICDSGIGIAEGQFQAIFEEYHQIDNAARERSRGLGLGLSIVRRLGNLLGHRVSVRSRLGTGSIFSIEVAIPSNAAAAQLERRRSAGNGPEIERANHTGTILVVEDDPEVRELLETLLVEEGHRVAMAANGKAALALVARDATGPDLILADYNLPGGMDGLRVTRQIRKRFRRQIPVIILTGDISTSTLRDVAGGQCVQLNKPVKFKELTHAIQKLLSISRSASDPRAPLSVEAPARPGAVIFVVDDDAGIRRDIRSVLEGDGRAVEDYPDCEAFLEAYRPGRESCLLIDAYLPGMDGLELLQRLKDAGDRLPAIMITGSSDVPMVVQAMKAGASDFIEKPIGGGELLASVERALEQARDSSKLSAWRESAANQVASLTPRQRQIMDMVLAGHPSKNIAADLGISQRTVENHRASIMKKTGSKSLPELARLALAAAGSGEADQGF